MGDYLIALVLCIAITTFIWAAYKNGYRKGAQMVLKSWKDTIKELDDDTQ